MKKSLLLGIAALTLGACSGNSVAVYGPDGATGGGIGSGDDPVVGEDTCLNSSLACTGDVTAVSYNETDDVLIIQATPFDEEPRRGTFVRADTVDNSAVGTPAPYGYDESEDNVNGYAAYENDDPLAINPYLAIYDTSEDGSISVGQVSVMAGYRSYGYSGYFYRLNDGADLPEGELATYRGDYAGIVAYEGSGVTHTSEGTVFFEVDFADGYIKGGTDGRVFNRPGGDTVQRDLIFDDTLYSGNSYQGQAINFDDDGETRFQGTYQGVFGGDDANTTGGVFVVIDEEFEEVENLNARETGIYLVEKEERTPTDRTTP